MKRHQAPLDHPWFEPGQPPVLIAVGRLQIQKDYPTLLQAFAQVRQKRPVRLLILGEGKERPMLEELIKTLGVEEDVSLPGFRDDPFAYWPRASLFVLSSRWEGPPHRADRGDVLWTRSCRRTAPVDLAQILREGQYGQLVPVASQRLLARAIETTLDAKTSSPPRRVATLWSWTPWSANTPACFCEGVSNNMPTSNRPLRILHIILALKPTNGQYNEHCLPMRTSATSRSVPTSSPRHAPHRHNFVRWRHSLRGFHRALRAALRDREYDVIHVHTPHAGVLLLMTLLLSGLYRKLAPSTVHTIQNSFQNFKLRNKLLFIPSFVYFRRLVFCSDASYESFPAFLKWLGAGRMSVVQNAVDSDRVDRLRESTPRPSDQFTLATVGLIAIKNR